MENDKKIQEDENEKLENQLAAKSEEYEALATKLQETESEKSNEIAQLQQQIVENEEKYQVNCHSNRKNNCLTIRT